MISPGVTIFPKLHHVLQEQLALGRALGFCSPQCRKEPVEISRDYSCN